jgi:hypothetical protein
MNRREKVNCHGELMKELGQQTRGCQGSRDISSALVRRLLFTVASADAGRRNKNTWHDHQHMAPSGESDIKSDGHDVRNTAAAARMRRAIEGASRDGSSQTELKDAARELVGELKDASQPPEQVLLMIKQLLADAGLRPSYSVPTEAGTQTGREASLYRDVIAWSIRHYYDGDGKASDGDGKTSG